MYFVKGQLFFASTESLLNYFKKQTISGDIVIDFSESHGWDESTILTLIKVKKLLASKGASVTIQGLNVKSTKLIKKITGSTTI